MVVVYCRKAIRVATLIFLRIRLLGNDTNDKRVYKWSVACMRVFWSRLTWKGGGMR